MKFILLLSLLASALALSCCESDDDSFLGEESHQFLTLHNNENSELGAGAYLSILKVKDGEVSYEILNNTYPAADLRNNVEIKNNLVAIGLHADFNAPCNYHQTNGAWFDISDNSYEILPLLPPGQGRYSFFSNSIAKVCNSGYVFYLSASNDVSYYNQYRASLIRFNPRSGVLDVAADPTSFVVSQPERGWDTQIGQFTRSFYPSNKGRYVYGVLESLGAGDGAFHGDYKILFKYDFEKEKYTRLGDTEDSQVSLFGITSDGEEMLYQSSNALKLVNVNTHKTSKITIGGGQGYSNTSQWNNFGYCSSEAFNTICVYNLLANEKQTIKTPSYPNCSQFSADGKHLYFMLESAKGKFLCKTSDLSPETSIDTVCALPFDTKEFMVIK